MGTWILQGSVVRVLPMIHVLIVITVFTSTSGVTSNTRFQEFNTLAACERARDGVESWARDLKGPLSRNIFAACYPKG